MAQPQSRLLSLLLELGRPSRQCLGLTRTRRPRPWTRPLPLDLGHHGQTRSQSQSRPRIPGSRLARPLGLVAGGGLLLTAFVVIYESGFVQASRPAGKAAPDDTRDRSLPRLRLATVREHDGRSAHPWVTHEDKVYDITDWVAAHPGGDVILRAAGGALEPT
ncbi:hypothetical protein P8C59_002810 [Phyllachora maydis]|uniref:Cytochrome b5 heme-binding domain-containing protein n=1 Tax=Phyllachora maydis TaxID=1825666 RepID=A0AAD9HZ56_9PEZI|nr:hypothetical protein P8C59_002810 [Phyllachora maydis]